MIEDKILSKLKLIKDNNLRLVRISHESFLKDGTDYISRITMRFASIPNIEGECEAAFLFNDCDLFFTADKLWESPCYVSLIINDLCNDGLERIHYEIREAEGLFSFYCGIIEVIV